MIFNERWRPRCGAVGTQGRFGSRESSMNNKGHWTRRFKAIPLADGRNIASLAEARNLLASLPPDRQDDRHWKYAGDLLVRAAARNEKYSTMDARSQLARARRTSRRWPFHVPAMERRR